MPTCPAMRSVMVVLLFTALLGGCDGQNPSRPTPRTVPASTMTVEVVEAVECRSFPAQVESRNSVTLASKLSGTVVEVAAGEGTLLGAGQLILRVDDKDLKSRAQGLAATRGQIASERQALEARASHAKANLDRLSRLLAQKVVSQDDFDKARTEYLFLAREVEASSARERSVAAQEEELASLGGYTRITAPFDGTLTRRFVDLGAFVTAGQPLAMVDDVSSGYDLVAQVDESMLAGLTVGQQVVGAAPGLGATPFPARLVSVVGRVDPATRTFKVKAELPSGPARPGTGMSGRIFLPTRVSRKLLLPLECLRLRGDLATVFVIEGSGEARLRVVKTGGRFIKVMLDGKPYLTDSEAFDSPVAPGFVEVLSGLSAGERVACSNLETLRQGDRIEGAAR